MDNCKTYHTAFVVEAINSRRYKSLFMPPYSAFLNLIEECWSKIKSLDDNSTLTPHIMEACQRVTVDDCLGWIGHSGNYWDSCINKEIGLK